MSRRAVSEEGAACTCAATGPAHNIPMNALHANLALPQPNRCAAPRLRSCETLPGDKPAEILPKTARPTTQIALKCQRLQQGTPCKSGGVAHSWVSLSHASAHRAHKMIRTNAKLEDVLVVWPYDTSVPICCRFVCFCW